MFKTDGKNYVKRLRTTTVAIAKLCEEQQRKVKYFNKNNIKAYTIY